MARKPAYAVYLSCLVAMLSLGTSFDTLGQLSNFGLPEKQTAPTEEVTAHGVLSIDKVQPGSTFQIAVVMEFAEPWHANANPGGRRTSYTDSGHLARCARCDVWRDCVS